MVSLTLLYGWAAKFAALLFSQHFGSCQADIYLSFLIVNFLKQVFPLTNRSVLKGSIMEVVNELVAGFLFFYYVKKKYGTILQFVMFLYNVAI